MLEWQFFENAIQPLLMDRLYNAILSGLFSNVWDGGFLKQKESEKKKATLTCLFGGW